MNFPTFLLPGVICRICGSPDPCKYLKSGCGEYWLWVCSQACIDVRDTQERVEELCRNQPVANS